MKAAAGLLIVAMLFVASCSRPSRDAAERDADIPVSASSPGGAEPRTVPARRVEPSVTRPRIVFLGDSLTAGYGLATKDQAVPALIQKRLDAEGYDYEVVNHGVSGDTSAGGVSRLDWALQGDVRILVLELGGNDGLRGIPVETMKANLSDIMSRTQARGITVLLTGMEAPPNHGPAYTREFRQTFRDLAREHHVPLVPFYLEGVAGVSALNQPDGIHPTAEGSVIIERTIWNALKPLLETPVKTDTTPSP